MQLAMRTDKTTSSLQSDSSVDYDGMEEDNFVMLGLAKGKIVVVNIYQIDKIISRYEFMRDDVTMIRELAHIQAFLAFDKIFQLSLFRLSEKGVEVL